jgi:hypothetical protein
MMEDEMNISLWNKTINFDGDISAIKNITEIDDVMRQLSLLLNVQLGAVKMSTWFIQRKGVGMLAGDESKGQKRRARFHLALCDALGNLGYAVAYSTPIK